MKKLLTLLAVSAVLLTGCDSIEQGDSSLAPIASLTHVEVNGYTITTNTSTVGEERTYTYTVTGLNDAGPASDFTFFETVCDPLSYSPKKASKKTTLNLDGEEVSGRKWNASISADGERTYTFTYSATDPQGSVRAAISRGGNVAWDWVPGASCGGASGTYTVAGDVYVESGDNASRGPSESGIEGVTVALYDLSGQPVTDALNAPIMAVTENDGTYVLEGVPVGEFHVVIPKPNHVVYDTYGTQPLYTFAGGDTTGTGAAFAPIEVTDDIENVSFGFALQIETIVAALQDPDSEYATTTPLALSDWRPLLAGLTDFYEVEVNGFFLRFLGAGYNSSGTTFRYKVVGPGRIGGVKDLSHITFEIDASCANLVSYTPTSGVSIGLDPTTGLTGIKFDGQVKVDEEKEFTLTFSGMVNPGIAKVALKNGRDVDEALMPTASSSGCDNQIGTEGELDGALDFVFYEGSGDETYAFLQYPLVTESGRTRLVEAVEILVTPPDPGTQGGRRTLLLVAELVLGLGQGSASSLDQTLFQAAEAEYARLYESGTASRTTTSASAATSTWDALAAFGGGGGGTVD